MGADGHLVILDLQKVLPLVSNPCGWYQYKFLDKDILVGYYGDYPMGYDCLPCILCGANDCSDENHRAVQEQVLKVATIAKWEVWT